MAFSSKARARKVTMLLLGAIYAVVLGGLTIGAAGLLWAAVSRRPAHARVFGAVFGLSLLGLLAGFWFGILAMG